MIVLDGKPQGGNGKGNTENSFSHCISKEAIIGRRVTNFSALCLSS